MKKKLIVIGLIFVMLLVPVSCAAPVAPAPTPAPSPAPAPAPAPTPAPAPAPAPTSDTKQIETVLQEYYEAFNSYDLDRVSKVIAEEALKEERDEILLSFAWAESMNFKCELKSITSIQISGDVAGAIAECETSAGPGQDIWHLVREYGSWKLASKMETPSTAPEKPALTPSEQAYAAAIIDQSTRVSEAFTELGMLLENLQIGDDQWTFRVAVCLVEIRAVYDEAMQLDPPSSMAEIHLKYTQTMKHFNNATYLLTQGVDELDPTLLEAATEELLTGVQLNEETIQLVHEFKETRK